MIGRRMANIIKCLARHRDDMRLANFQSVRGLDPKWKLLRCPIEYCLPNLTPLWANRNLGANRSDVVSGGILKREVLERKGTLHRVFLEAPWPQLAASSNAAARSPPKHTLVSGGRWLGGHGTLEPA